MRRSASSSTASHGEPLLARTPEADTSLLQAVILLACLIPALIAFSSALAQEQLPAAASTPARVERGWIEPAAPASTTEPSQASSANRPATLRLPHDAPKPITGSRLPDLPAAADFDSRLIGSFTSSIQPLLLNRCAAGKCHGVNTSDTDTAAPQFRRQSIRGNVSRELTLANIDALTATVLPDHDLRRLLKAAGTPHGGASLPPLTPPQLQRLAIWIDAALAQRSTWGRVEQASFEAPLAAPRLPARPVAPAPPTTPVEGNRFQRMLDDAANPQPLPPPQEPSGIIPLDDLPEAQPQAD